MGTTPGFPNAVSVLGRSLFKSSISPNPPPRLDLGRLTGLLVDRACGGVDFNGVEVQKFLSSDNFFVPGDIKGFISAKLLVHSSIFVFPSLDLGGLLGLTLLTSTFSREKAEAKRRSSTGGGVLGISFGSTGGVGVALSLCRLCCDFEDVFRSAGSGVNENIGGSRALSGGVLVGPFAVGVPLVFAAYPFFLGLKPSEAKPVLVPFVGERKSSLTPENT